MADMPRKAVLYNELKLAKESGAPVEFPPGIYVQWTEAQLDAIHQQIFGTNVSHEQEPVDQEVIPEAGIAWEAALAAVATPVPVADAPEPERPAPSQGTQAAPAPQSGAEAATDDLHDHPELWAQYAPETLARLLRVPFQDRGADRAGLTFNTHGPNDPVRVDSLGRVWYRDEVPKPAIPKRRMIRKTKTMSSNVVEIKTKRPDGGFDESFEIAGDEQHEVEVKVTMPSSQVGVYRDPRFPFKIHQYNGRRGFDHDEIRDYYGGLDLIPTEVRNKTIYIDSDLCFDMNAVRDSIEREYNMKVLGRNVL
ncbi:hypothetical protein SEA_ZHENGYI_45 [Microbacterium phage Zhengyi]|nr:hypothetical protein SEA_ZHENGYI_45 [Microbacterium phage Zhengyi]QYC53815.1 hypothetical protein SEA_EUGENEKRABS_45 [Microbacterium phage EugeneKrabs]